VAERKAGIHKADLPIEGEPQGRFGCIRRDGVVASSRYVDDLHRAMHIAVVSRAATDLFGHAGLRCPTRSSDDQFEVLGLRYWVGPLALVSPRHLGVEADHHVTGGQMQTLGAGDGHLAVVLVVIDEHVHQHRRHETHDRDD
jgi:hypothetical protein